jgi:ADP-L-glycero-D-manno-heptose 6-epimerase
MIIVTGATGFIGSNLVADLNDAGRTDIVIVDNLESNQKWRNIAKRRFIDIVHPEEVEAFLQGARKVEVVLHMGANSSTTVVDGDSILKTNLRATMNWWRWCTEHGVPLIYASSAATYGDGDQGFVDDQSLDALDKLRPLNLYGWSKHAFDKWAIERAAEKAAPPQWAGLKFFNVYGPNEWHKGDMQSLVSKNYPTIAAGKPISLFKSHKEGFSDGEQLRDFVYVKDCTAVMKWLFEKGNVSGLFNLGTGKARSFRDLMLATGAAIGRGVDINYVDMPEIIRPNYQYFTQASMSKLREAGYEAPFRSLEEGVGDYVRNYLASPDKYR